MTVQYIFVLSHRDGDALRTARMEDEKRPSDLQEKVERLNLELGEAKGEAKRALLDLEVMRSATATKAAEAMRALVDLEALRNETAEARIASMWMRRCQDTCKASLAFSRRLTVVISGTAQRKGHIVDTLIPALREHSDPWRPPPSSSPPPTSQDLCPSTHPKRMIAEQVRCILTGRMTPLVSKKPFRVRASYTETPRRSASSGTLWQETVDMILSS